MNAARLPSGESDRWRLGRPLFAFAARAPDVARPLAAARVERDRLAVGAELELVERKTIRGVGRAARGGQRRGDFRLIERRGARARRRIDQEEFRAVLRGRPIPEPLVANPRRLRGNMQHEPVGVVAEELLSPGVVVRGERPRLRMGRQGERHDRRGREKGRVTEVGGLHPPIIDQPAAGSDVEADLR